jgi:hypothetical protein
MRDPEDPCTALTTQKEAAPSMYAVVRAKMTMAVKYFHFEP